ncbi:MAG: oxidoreductase [Hyphomicrobiales bacterium]|nr:oxidoreductase [Hyphomicrobiales bacterium]
MRPRSGEPVGIAWLPAEGTGPVAAARLLAGASGLRSPTPDDYQCGATPPKGETVTSVTAIATEPAATAETLIEVRLTGIRYAARDVNLYEFQRLDGEPLPAYEPGAHIDLHLPSGLLRNYSLAVAAPQPSTYTVGIKRDPASRGGSRYIHDELRVGATLKIGGPRNNFRLREDAAHSVLIAGGIGITPIWCMAQRLIALGRDWRLYYAARSRAEMAFCRELEALPQAVLHFDDESGHLLDVASIVAAAPQDAHLYCCGPAPMLAAFEVATKAWLREQVHVEYFTPRELPPAKKGGFTVVLARSGSEHFIPEGESILNVLLDAGVDLDYSCELGICGACEQRVIAGIPEHRDSILSEEEQAANQRVMICCAGSRTERLVLDL